MRRVQSRSDFIGYRHQFARVMRLCGRRYAPQPNERQFQDDMFSFFMHCFHLQDWVEGDPVAPKASKRKVRQALAQSKLFPICRDIAVGSKHLHIADPKSGQVARYAYVEMTVKTDDKRPDFDVIFDDGHGNALSGLALALNCANEWRLILKQSG